MGRIMAVDWGERRIGIALSDESHTIGSPYTVIKRGNSLKRDLVRISDIALENAVERIIFGLPVQLDGSMGFAAERIMEVVEKVRMMVQIEVDTWDERLSTSAAERALIDDDVSRKKRKQVVDQIAAALILQSYLDSQSSFLLRQSLIGKRRSDETDA